MEVNEEAGEEVVEAVDEEEEDVDLGILKLAVMINGRFQALMETCLKFIHRIVLNKTSGSI